MSFDPDYYMNSHPLGAELTFFEGNTSEDLTAGRTSGVLVQAAIKRIGPRVLVFYFCFSLIVALSRSSMVILTPT